MGDKEKKGWGGLCHPCKKIGVCATGNVYCENCRQIYCSNCTKLHKANELSRRHSMTTYLGNVHLADSNLDITGFKYDQFGNEEKDLQKVKNDYIKAISSDHDHTKYNYPDELFCVKHREVVCKSCKFRRHSLCSGCLTVRRASQVLIESGQYLRVISRLKNCHVLSKTALKETRRERELLNSKESQILQQIQELKNAMIRQVYKLENELLETLYGSQGKTLKNLTKAENILKRIIQSSENMLESLKDETKDGIEPSSFKSIIESHGKSVLFNKILERICEFCDIGNLHECVFQPEYTVESIIHCLGSLGNLSVDKLTSQVPLILLGTKEKTVSDSIENNENEISMAFGDEGATCTENYLDNIMDKYSQREQCITRWSNPDFLKYGIVGIICLDKDDMLVLDRTSCSVMLIDTTGEPVSSYQFKCIPWAMTLYGVNILAVSIPGEHKIILIAIEFKDFAFKKEIKCSVEPSAITSYQENIFVTSYPWSDKAAVHKITDDGKIVSTLDKEETSGKRLFKAPLDIAVDKDSGDIFVCDSGLKMLFAFAESLQEKFRIDLEYMGHPSSLTLDSQGNIYICGKLSNVIYKVTTAKQRGKIVFTENDGLSRPQAICNIPNEGAICVLCARDNTFKILNIS